MTSTLPAPLDVKLMNLTATVLFLGCMAFVLVAGGAWVLRYPGFAIARIVVNGDLVHNNAITLRANVAPHLVGNFFTVDLRAARQAFEQVPWVRQAQIKREFPHTLSVHITEQDAAAVWGSEGESRLLNSDGQIFEGDSSDPDLSSLPHLAGPAGRSTEVLGMFQVLGPLFAKLDNPLVNLRESDSGSWKATLQSGAVIEMGQGSTEEMRQRVGKFVDSLPEVSATYRRSVALLTSADLRHAGGYAVRMQGVTTGTAPTTKPVPNKKK